VLGDCAYTDAHLNYAEFSDPDYDAMVDRMRATADKDQQNAIIKEAAVYLLAECAFIPLRSNVGRISWWPWVRNYHGEWAVVEQDHVIAVMTSAWIDEDLKKEMGY
jgi:peptide/nickel transport system substrate-binding protein